MPRPLIITTGEPAGIGPDICLGALAAGKLDDAILIGDHDALLERASMLGLDLELPCYPTLDAALDASEKVRLLQLDLPAAVTAGLANPENSSMLLKMLELAVDACCEKQAAAMVTAPIAKHVLNEAGIKFTGHTEFIAKRCNVQQPVMLLTADSLRVALVTTHLPLKSVAAAITPERVEHVLRTVHNDMIRSFDIAKPRITLLGLNPHAGENGYLGREEKDIIIPVVEKLRTENLLITGPVPADTAFTLPVRANTDVFIAMYHDQGLPVLKFAGFNRAVNTTLGLPIIRTSVDHGTAFDLAGSGRAQADSLLAAIRLARNIADNQARL